MTMVTKFPSFAVNRTPEPLQRDPQWGGLNSDTSRQPSLPGLDVPGSIAGRSGKVAKFAQFESNQMEP